MGLLDFLVGPRAGADKPSNGVHKKLEELSEQIKKLDGVQKDNAHSVIRELRELRHHDTMNREEVLKRIESVQEKLQFATEEYIVSDEDVKQMVRNCLKSRAKTFNEIQKDTKISPQALLKYLRMMKGEVEEFNGVYRIVFSSSLVYLGKGAQKENDHLAEMVGADTFANEYDTE